VARFAQLWARYTTRRGFRLVLAKADGQVVGIALGHYLPTDTDWGDGTLTPMPDGVTGEQGDRTFAVIELAVRKPYRRRGIARAMHHQLLTELTAERITLLVRPEQETAPARAAYVSWGYRKIGQIRPGDDAPVYDSMMLLCATPSTTQPLRGQP
jgi:ribosomal protein S18 acetylase RimI-like enzyme